MVFDGVSCTSSTRARGEFGCPFSPPRYLFERVKTCARSLCRVFRFGERFCLQHTRSSVFTTAFKYIKTIFFSSLVAAFSISMFLKYLSNCDDNLGKVVCREGLSSLVRLERVRGLLRRQIGVVILLGLESRSDGRYEDF